MTELSEDEKNDVRLQTERLISSTYFRHSKRYVDLLRFIVEKTLAGQPDTLKERTLGIEVFQREPTFNTSGDSIVRVAAAEVRKRIAQYYQEVSHQGELRIELPPGSYVAQFRLTEAAAPKPRVDTADAVANANIAGAVSSSERSSRGRMARALTVSLVALLIAAVAIGTWFFGFRERSADILKPFWRTAHDVTICIGSPHLTMTQPGVSDETSATALGPPAANNAVIPFGDALTLSRVQSLMNEHRKPSRVRLSRFTTFNDLRAGPVVLIGALDNSWTMRLASKLRFQVVGSDGAQGSVLDSKSSSTPKWTVNFRIPYSDRTKDYAIVAITHDATLEQPVILLAGVGPNGTMAAGEFLSNDADLNLIARGAPRGWNGTNVELVLETQVIDGNSGPPRIIASEYW